MLKTHSIVVHAFVKGYRVTDNGAVRSPYGKILKTTAGSNGYKKFSIRYKKKRETVAVHMLAAFQKFSNQVFNSNIEVRHLDGNKTNNELSNIEIGTHSENMLDRPEEDRIYHARSAARFNRALSDTDASEAQNMFRQGSTVRDVMERFGIAKATASAIKTGKTYKDISAE